MKKFIIFILLLSLLIISEYYFLTEIFTHRRVLVMALSLPVTLVCLYSLIRLFKRTILTS